MYSLRKWITYLRPKKCAITLSIIYQITKPQKAFKNLRKSQAHNIFANLACTDTSLERDTSLFSIIWAKC